ncbi:nitroreductase [Desulfocapsa sulfexigens DSM 10523]|uniref:Nitroreductase n=1 Tax=Desulfocapsa sulfexigens (strain DSM 10523 / SB164P1) TaxID=1167006 RepID=M1NZN8_DESSD|nr:nitroreductase family protein [Desulfocapsa sulfexigens]AGF76748.1 nitroreductase [Desulfocapsa sulfexigens DSM 10523]
MFIELLRKRRSVRQFQDKAIEQDKVDLLIEAMLRAPSSRSLYPWEFIVVQDKNTIEALAKAKVHGSAFMKNASLAIAVCADPDKCDVWVEDCSIATLLLHLEATDLGLGSCWVQIRLREHDNQRSAEAYVAETLGLKEGMVVEAVVAIGYPEKESNGHPDSSLLKDRVSFERYGNRG